MLLTSESLRRNGHDEAAAAEVKHEELPADKSTEPVAYTALFRYATRQDKLLLALGMFGAIGTGAARPASSILFGNVINGFAGYIALGTSVCGFAQGYAFSTVADRLTNTLRRAYLSALLKSEIGFFDLSPTGALVSRLATDVALVQQAVGVKLGVFTQVGATFVSGLVIGLARGWQLALVMIGLLPLIGFAGVQSAKAAAADAARTAAGDATSASYMGELFGAVRTVVSFTGEARAVAAYDTLLAATGAQVLGSRVAKGAGAGSVQFIVFGSYALLLWFGAVLIGKGILSGGTVLSVFFAVMQAGSSISQAATPLDAFARGCGAAAPLYAAIDRVPEMRDPPGGGIVLGKGVVGELALENVAFYYPARPNQAVFESLSLSLPAGEMTALVGESGSGKSSVIQLLLRFYDPTAGRITLDGTDLRSISLTSLRGRIGLVGQEPVLFACTLAENLRYGKPDATDAELKAACDAAYASGFISKLASGLATHTGDRGGQLSGGQKQRIAIARAILKDPAVLLLDEATSALDCESEAKVQAALESVRRSARRTTVAVAHRLLTIRDADTIVVLRRGAVVESGSHTELAGKSGGAYAALLTLQEGAAAAKKEEASPPSSVRSPSSSSRPVRGPSPPPPEAELPASPRSGGGGGGGGGGRAAGAAVSGRRKSGSGRSVSGSFGPGLASQVSGGVAALLRLKQDTSMAFEGTTAVAFDNRGHGLTSHGVEAALLVVSPPGPAAAGALASTGRSPSSTPSSRSKLDAALLSVVVEEAEQPPTLPEAEKVPLRRLAGWFVPQVGWFGAGAAASCVQGGVFPVFALLLSRMLVVFYLPPSQVASHAVFWSLMFFMLGCVAWIASTTAAVCGGVLSAKVAARVKSASLSAALRQEVAFFDARVNSSGALASRLASDAQTLRVVVSDGAFALLQAFATFASGLGIAFAGGWQLALVMLGTVPLMGVAFYTSAKALGVLASDQRPLYEAATQLATDAVSNMRTVAAFCAEARVLAEFDAATAKAEVASAQAARVQGASQSFAQAMSTLPTAFVFYIGGVFISQGTLTFGQVMQVFLALTLAVVGVTQVSQASGTVGDAGPAATALFLLVDRAPAIDAGAEGGLQPDTCPGRLELRNVKFSYPARPAALVLKGLSLACPPGLTTALVGESGSGKSTVIQLLMRMYDPASGSVFLDGADMRQLNPRWLRSHVGLVQQEPALFGGSIAFNVAYGKENATPAEVAAALDAAHAGGFVALLPDGADTLVGERGVALSGGQKQRVAIARAFLKDAPVLLLDEATSALDAESEKAVQDALSRLMQGRTCVVVAHRLSTIRNAHSIAVLGGGELLEQGAHDELIAKHGKYATLVALRSEHE